MISNVLLLGEVAKNVDMVDDVFWGVTWGCILSLVAITIAMLYFMVRYRRRGDAIGADIHGSTSLEITWTVIPTIIVMIMFYFGWKGFVDLRAQPEGALEIQVVGGQWNWNYTYSRVVKDEKGKKQEVTWKVEDAVQPVISGYVETTTKGGITSKSLLEVKPPTGHVDAITGRWIVFLDGGNHGESREISRYDAKTGSISWEVDLVKPCTAGDKFEIKGRLVRSILYVPVNRPVILRLGSVDVLHSYFIPAFRTKEDAVPGLDTYVSFEARETGVFEVLCAEYCGAPPEPDLVAVRTEDGKYVPEWLGHHNMKTWVQVVPEKAFAMWSDEWVKYKMLHANLAKWKEEMKAWEASGSKTGKPVQPDAPGKPKPMSVILEELENSKSTSSIMNEGHPGLTVLEKRNCFSCHRRDGSEQYAPSFLGMFGKTTTVITDGKKRNLEIDAGYIRKSIEKPSADIVEEYEGRFPRMLPERISDEELALVVGYLKGLK